MALGCLFHDKETPNPQKDCKDCPDFHKKYFAYEDFIQSPDGGAMANCVHVKVKWKPRKLRR